MEVYCCSMCSPCLTKAIQFPFRKMCSSQGLLVHVKLCPWLLILRVGWEPLEHEQQVDEVCHQTF